jgi:hypothetical protein
MLGCLRKFCSWQTSKLDQLVTFQPVAINTHNLILTNSSLMIQAFSYNPLLWGWQFWISGQQITLLCSMPPLFEDCYPASFHKFLSYVHVFYLCNLTPVQQIICAIKKQINKLSIKIVCLFGKYKVFAFLFLLVFKALQWLLFIRNHTISFICLEKIMSQQKIFTGHFIYSLWEILCRKIAIYIPAEFSREFILSLFFPANDRKPTERLFFNTVTMEFFWRWTRNLLATCQLPYSLRYEVDMKIIIFCQT